MGSSVIVRGAFFPDAEARLLRHVFDQVLNSANEKFDQLYSNSDQYYNLRLVCDENNSCGLHILNEKQRQKQLRETIDLERHTNKSHSTHHH